MTDQEVKASGVQELIDRLSEEGVVEGQRQADLLTAAAQAKASEILNNAEQKAKAIVQQARDKAERIQAAGQDALALAARDAVRHLESQIHDGFRSKLKRLIVHTLDDREYLQRMILEIAKRSSPTADAGPVEVILPEKVVSDQELLERIEAGEEVALLDFVRDLTGDTIRDGFTLATTDADEHGLRVVVKDQDIEIELTDDAITDLLASHLLPRFRSIIHS